MDCRLPGSSVHGIFQARILDWVAISFSRGSSLPRYRTRVSHTAGRLFTIWATREAPKMLIKNIKTILCILFNIKKNIKNNINISAQNRHRNIYKNNILNHWNLEESHIGIHIRNLDCPLWATCLLRSKAVDEEKCYNFYFTRIEPTRMENKGNWLGNQAFIYVFLNFLFCIGTQQITNNIVIVSGE